MPLTFSLRVGNWVAAGTVALAIVVLALGHYRSGTSDTSTPCNVCVKYAQRLAARAGSCENATDLSWLTTFAVDFPGATLSSGELCLTNCRAEIGNNTTTILCFNSPLRSVAAIPTPPLVWAGIAVGALAVVGAIVSNLHINDALRAARLAPPQRDPVAKEDNLPNRRLSAQNNSLVTLNTSLRKDELKNQLLMHKSTVLLLRAHRLRIQQQDVVTRWEGALQSVLDIAESLSGEVVHVDFQQILLCWNVHMVCPEHPIEACKAALKVKAAMDKAGVHHYGIAVASGELLCGFLGSRSTRFCVVVGEAREQVEQLQSLCEILNTSILITQLTADHIGGTQGMSSHVVDSVLFQSRFHNSNNIETDSAMVFELTWTAPKNRELFRHAFSAFCDGEYEKCESLVDAYLEINPDNTHGHRLRSMLGRREELGVGIPYYRLFVGWQRFDSSSSGGETTKELRPGSSKSHLKWLKSELDKKHVLAVSDCDNDFFEEDDMDQHEEDVFPTILLDVENHVWRRSLKPVGTGRTAAVYKGLSEVGVVVALKVLKLSPEVRESLLHEVELLAKLRHPNILPYIACACAANAIIIITQFVSGGALDTMLEQFGPMPNHILKRFLRDIVRGVRYLHSQSFMHSDIKPANVLLDTDGVCKLSDFGTASHLSESEGLRGTPLYMAPEQARGKPCAASDIWALGIMVLVLATNATPYLDNPTESTGFVYRMGQGKLTPVIPETLDPELKEMLAGCLTKDCKLRLTAEALHSHRYLM